MKMFQVEPGFGIGCGGRWYRYGQVVVVDRGEKAEVYVLNSEGDTRGHIGTHRYDDLTADRPPLGLRKAE